jgi:ABC-type branched-subunit amino acid transport system ATPase component
LFPILGDYRDRPCGQLSGGEQQMVALGRAMMAHPRILLLDEPTSGLAPAISDGLYAAITSLAERGVGILVVEQSVDRALRYSDRTYVMENGRIVHEGRSSDLSRETLAGAIAGVKAEAI